MILPQRLRYKLSNGVSTIEIDAMEEDIHRFKDDEILSSHTNFCKFCKKSKIWKPSKFMKFLFNDEESCMDIYRSNCSVHQEECNGIVLEIHRDCVQFLGGVKIILFLFLRVTDHSGPLGGTGLILPYYYNFFSPYYYEYLPYHHRV